MRFYVMLLASVLMALAWLLPLHYRPWVTYSGELCAFLSLFCLATLYLKQQLKVPLATLPVLALAFVPLVQWLFGLVFFFDKALLSSAYLFGFWLSIVLAYNLSDQPSQRSALFTGFSQLLWLVGLLSAVIAVCQWLNIEQHIPGMTILRGNRPYANFAQPNNMATFLVLAFLATWYLYEKRQMATWLASFSALLLLFCIALSLSRTSWLALLFILAYGSYQYYRKQDFRLRWHWGVAWIGLYIAIAFALPSVEQLLAQLSGSVTTQQSLSVIERASSSHLRLGIWQQMLYGIAERPWFGYGWHQTSVAQSYVSEYYRILEWVRSAHNVILDFLVWNGLLIGLPMLGYVIYVFYYLHRHLRSTESIIGMLMFSAVLIHAMLEYPQQYAYFLLPLGLIIGLIISQHQLKHWQASPRLLQLSFALCGIILLLIVRDYQVVTTQLNQSLRYEKTPEKISNHQPVYVLEELKRRITWIQMSPWQHLTDAELLKIEELVRNYPTKYDLLKYAKVLAYNGKVEQAQHQLWLLKELRGLDVSYPQLLIGMPK